MDVPGVIARTNWFPVKNPAAFIAAMKPYDLTIVIAPIHQHHHNADGISLEHSFGLSPTSDQGWPVSRNDPATNTAVAVDFPQVVSEHLAEGHVAIFIEISTDLTYVDATATAVNHAGQRVHVDLMPDILEAAQPLGTHISYPMN